MISDLQSLFNSRNFLREFQFKGKKDIKDQGRNGR